MGKTALFALAAFTVLGGYYGLTSQQSLFSSTQTLSAHQYTAIARAAANVGLEKAKQKLDDSFTDAHPMLSGTYDNAKYQTAFYPANAAQVLVVSDGSFFVYSTFETHRHQIRAWFEQVEITGDEAPPFMQYAILSDEDLTIRGNVETDTVAVVGSENTLYNANVHSNGSLKTDGRKPKIRGYGSYKVSKDIKFQSDIFKPYVNRAQEPNTVNQVTEGVTVPEFTTAAIASDMAALSGVDQVTVGPVTLTDMDFEAMGATAENPYVWHIQGDLTGSGNVTLNGYVMFIVDGNISLSGNLYQGSHENGNESTAAFYAQGDISTHGNVELWGQMFANGNVDIGGNPVIVGSVTAGGSVEVHGAAKVKYFPPSPSLSQPFSPKEYRITMVDIMEREG